MKPTTVQKIHLRKYFRGIEHGSKCPKCELPGQIIDITHDTIELQCGGCENSWIHHPETTISKLIEKMMFLDK